MYDGIIWIEVTNYRIGTNNVPLGSRRRITDGRDRSKSPPSALTVEQDRPERGRRKRNRWGAAAEENKIANLINLPVALGGLMTQEQQEAYALHLRIEEISQKLRISDVVPRDGERSPSPPPQYDNMGKRVNTREVRYREKLENERHKLVVEATKTIPNYKLPVDYRPPVKTQEKIYIPVNDYPEINFIGLLIGPRGNTLKKMETESGAKIAIRGEGSVKDGKGRTDVGHQGSMDDALHCLIIADDERKIQKAIELVNKVIETAASTPEEQNEHKRHQLRELAALNGTLRDDEGQPCQNCGEIGHRRYDCPQRRNYTASVICHICGNQGHFARDCKDRPSAGYGNSYRPNNYHQQQIDNGPTSAADKEYEQLMLELGTGRGGSGNTGNNGPQRMIENGSRGGGRYGNDGPSGGPAPWVRDNNNSGSAPWKRRDDHGNDRYRDRSDNYNSRDRGYERRDGGRGGYGNDRYNDHDNRDSGHSRGGYNNRENDGYNRSGDRNQDQGRNDGWSSHQPVTASYSSQPPQAYPSGPATGFRAPGPPAAAPGMQGRVGPPGAGPPGAGPPGASRFAPPPPPTGLAPPPGVPGLAPPPPPSARPPPGPPGAQAPPPPPSAPSN